MARNKARVSTRNMAMSRQKKLDKMDVIELAAEKPKPEFHFTVWTARRENMLFETQDLVIGYDEPLSKPLTFLHGTWAEDRTDRCKRNRKNNAVKEYFGIDTVYFR